MKPPVVDISVAWACPRCPYKHGPNAVCPPGGRWLVLHFCPDCDESKQLYCRTHRDRHMPQPGDPRHTLPPAGPEQAEHLRREAMGY